MIYPPQWDEGRDVPEYVGVGVPDIPTGSGLPGLTIRFGAQSEALAPDAFRDWRQAARFPAVLAPDFDPRVRGDAARAGSGDGLIRNRRYLDGFDEWAIVLPDPAADPPPPPAAALQMSAHALANIAFVCAAHSADRVTVATPRRQGIVYAVRLQDQAAPGGFVLTAWLAPWLRRQWAAMGHRLQAPAEQAMARLSARLGDPFGAGHFRARFDAIDPAVLAAGDGLLCATNLSDWCLTAAPLPTPQHLLVLVAGLARAHDLALAATL